MRKPLRSAKRGHRAAVLLGVLTCKGRQTGGTGTGLVLSDRLAHCFALVCVLQRLVHRTTCQTNCPDGDWRTRIVKCLHLKAPHSHTAANKYTGTPYGDTRAVSPSWVCNGPPAQQEYHRPPRSSESHARACDRHAASRLRGGTVFI